MVQEKGRGRNHLIRENKEGVKSNEKKGYFDSACFNRKKVAGAQGFQTNSRLPFRKSATICPRKGGKGDKTPVYTYNVKGKKEREGMRLARLLPGALGGPREGKGPSGTFSLPSGRLASRPKGKTGQRPTF